MKSLAELKKYADQNSHIRDVVKTRILTSDQARLKELEPIQTDLDPLFKAFSSSITGSGATSGSSESTRVPLYMVYCLFFYFTPSGENLVSQS